MNPVLTVSPRAPDDPQVVALLRRYGEDIAARYGSADPWLPPTPLHEYSPPRGAFLVVAGAAGEAPGELVACGGVHPYPAAPATAELNRMYVVPEHRRRGLARMLLRALEHAARDLGYRRLRLMTGVPQPEALALYTSSGYRRIEPFGPYSAEPTTRCFERELL